jgi:hypothetical protein
MLWSKGKNNTFQSEVFQESGIIWAFLLFCWNSIVTQGCHSQDMDHRKNFLGAGSWGGACVGGAGWANVCLSVFINFLMKCSKCTL